MPSPSGPAALPVTPDRIAKIRAFGLSEYAARAYLALLHLGTTEARDVSSVSKVPASKIYHILDQLHEKGLVVVLPEFPRKYAPVPFEDFLQRLHDQHEAAARDIREGMADLLAAFAVEGEATGSDRGAVTLLRGRRNVRDRAADLASAAKEDILLLLTEGQAANARPWTDLATEAQARGVRVRAMGGAIGDAPRARPAGLPTGAFALVVDGKHALLAHVLPDDGHPTDGNDTGLLVEQEGLVALLVGLLASHWDAEGRNVPLDVGASRLSSSP